MKDLSLGAAMAQLSGANQWCPGCKFEKKIPTKSERGFAEHFIDGRPYECHAGTGKWVGVPEFENQ